ncbi:MFS transporter [Microbacterium laevaniformans]|uniref:MFS transporter n=1 Tax=Microbacterium laevaniformans TaxID=36807 RepID=UPI003628CA64
MSGSLVAAGVLSVACAFAPTWEAFLALRAGGGLALAVLPAVALAYLRDAVRDDAHGRANALYISGTALGGAVGRLAPLPSRPSAAGSS